MNGRVDKIEVEKTSLAARSGFYLVELSYLIRYASEEEWTVISVQVQLPQQNYTIEELKQAAIAKAGDALTLASRHVGA